MSNGKWVEAEPDRAATCEVAFQTGGPKVYTQESSGRLGGWKQRPVPVSAKRATSLLWEGQTVYARRKVGGKFQWMKWVPAPTVTAAHEQPADGYVKVIQAAGEAKAEERKTFNEKLGEPAVFVPFEDDPRHGIGYWKAEGGVVSYRKYVNGYDMYSRTEYPDDMIDVLNKVRGE